jgi:hypothetical protein
VDRPPPMHSAAPRSATIADRRGLTTAGAAVVMIAFSAAGGAYDVLTGPGLRTVFAIFFVLGCGLAALAVHREHLRAVVVMPPLVYAALALTASAVEGWGSSGSFVQGQLLELANAIVLGAPVLVFGFLTTLLLAILRGAARRG